MNKKAVLLHGTDGNPNDLWFPWLQQQLESNGYEAFAPLLPDNHTPNREIYEEFLKNSGWDFSENLLIGHSSGAATVLNLLSSPWFPKVTASALVGVFLNERLFKANSPDWYDPKQFTKLWPEKYNKDTLKQKCNYFYFVHGTNDPYCDIEDARQLSNQLVGTFIEIPNGHHLAASSGIKELPQLIDVLRADKLL